MASYTLTKGMDVLASDSKKLGKIRHVFSAAAAPSGAPQRGPTDEDEEIDLQQGESAWTVDSNVPLGDLPVIGGQAGVLGSGIDFSPLIAASTLGSPDRSSHDAPAGGESDAPTFSLSDTKYIEVHHGGLLGIAGESLYVPFIAVDAIAPDSVTLNCTADEAMERFSRMPEPDPPPSGVQTAP